MSNPHVYVAGKGEAERQSTNRREAAEVAASHFVLSYLAVSSRWLTMSL